jgi:hypothetical protein
MSQDRSQVNGDHSTMLMTNECTRNTFSNGKYGEYLCPFCNLAHRKWLHTSECSLCKDLAQIINMVKCGKCGNIILNEAKCELSPITSNATIHYNCTLNT